MCQLKAGGALPTDVRHRSNQSDQRTVIRICTVHQNSLCARTSGFLAAVRKEHTEYTPESPRSLDMC